MIRLLNFRALSNSHVRLVKTKKDDQLQAHIDTRGFIRLFGSKGTKRNVFLSTRKSSQRLFLPLLLMPLYIVPLTDAAGLPYVSSVDFLSATLGLIVCHSVCLMRLYLARQQYPLVHNVLFNPYTGDVILESENWSSFVKSSFKLGRWRRATLVPRHIPRENAEQFHVLGTSSPQGMVIQPDEFSPRGEFVDGGHLGYVHYYNKFNEQPFDNYINELAANPLLNKMIDIRLGQERNYKIEDFKYGRNAHLVERQDELDIPNAPKSVYEAEARKQEFHAKMNEPFFNTNEGKRMD